MPSRLQVYIIIIAISVIPLSGWTGANARSGESSSSSPDVYRAQYAARVGTRWQAKEGKYGNYSSGVNLRQTSGIDVRPAVYRLGGETAGLHFAGLLSGHGPGGRNQLASEPITF